MSEKALYKSEIFIASVGMLVVTWRESPYGLVLELIEGYNGENKNCLLEIAGFDVLLAQAITRKTQQIKSAKMLSSLPD